jgi:copper chaperone CopZ
MRQNTVTTVLLITGMRENTCRERIVRALRTVGGVKDASVSLLRATAVVTYVSPCRPELLIEAVATAGYAAAVQESAGRH